MKRYEGLFILNTTGKDEGVNDAVDKISAEILAAGGKVETVQKMERKNFARVADKKHLAVRPIWDAVERIPTEKQRLKAE